MSNKSPNAKRRGFTLAELLVVITVIVLLFTVVAPNFSDMISSGIEDSAVSVISAATATARVYATRTQSFSAGSYQGAALLFTPGGEVRIVRHIESAADGGNTRLVDKSPPLAGYEDLPGEDFFSLPEAVGVVGVTRGGTAGSGAVYLMPPPFAVRFNSDGSLISRRTAKGSSSNMAMYYNGDIGGAGGGYVLSNTRTSSYNANLYDPRSSEYASSNFNAASGKISFAIDGIDTVVAVIAFKMNDFLDAGHKLGGTGASLGTQGQVSATAATWLKNNGRTIYFNRYTGTAITP